MEYTKDELKNIIKESIVNNDNATYHALMVIYTRQSEQEQSFGETIHLNGVGFGGMDSKILSSFAKQYDRCGSLSSKQLGLAKRLLPKYANQLFDNALYQGKYEMVKVLNPKTNRLVTKYRIKENGN